MLLSIQTKKSNTVAISAGTYATAEKKRVALSVSAAVVIALLKWHVLKGMP